MREKNYVDIREYSFDEFIVFWFDREISPEAARLNAWYRTTEIVFDLQKLSSYYVRLFREPRFLLDRFTVDQLFQGFAAMQRSGPGFTCSVKGLLWDTALPFSVRAECVRSMFYLFRDLFVIEPVRFTATMWWDIFCFDFEAGRRRRSHGGEDLAMQDVMFETLVAVLAIDKPQSHWAAIHGFSHLHHPDTVEVLHRFVAGHPAMERGTKRYALSVAMYEPFWCCMQFPKPRPPVTREEFDAEMEMMRERIRLQRKDTRLLRKNRQKAQNLLIQR